ncbi:metal-dependent transcriptional regulator [Mollicutes bacterium LVI A0039]|nr:metal-dependent transcriptional regulator [Mollicutes bacterium LVI A0039]
MKIHESGEMYLETILLLQKQVKCVRAIDVANSMEVTRASTSRALKQLKEMKLIVVDENGCITFSKEGEQIAKSIYDRHVKLTQFFELIGIDSETASADACKIEHVISDRSFEKIKQFIVLNSK